MDEKALKNTFIKAWDYNDPFEVDVLKALKRSEMYIEYTSIYSKIQWNTFSAIFHIKAFVDDLHILESNKNTLLEVAAKIFGRNSNYILTNVEIDILVESHEIIDFKVLGKSVTIQKTIKDAELFMANGSYSSAVDRIHTTMHGYLRWKLDILQIEHIESDTIIQLYSKIHNQILIDSDENLSKVIKTALRSASGVIDSINTARNKYSLSHPNKEIISEVEAKLLISLGKSILEYLENVKVKS